VPLRSCLAAAVLVSKRHISSHAFPPPKKKPSTRPTSHIAYLGPYTAPYRERMARAWLEGCRAAGIPCSDTFCLTAVLGNPVTIRSWCVSL
jgi:hypothetical protein